MLTDYELHSMISSFVSLLVLGELCVLAIVRNQSSPPSPSGRPWAAWGLHELRWWGAFLLGACSVIPVLTVFGVQMEGVVYWTISLGVAALCGAVLVEMRAIQEWQYRASRRKDES